MEEGDDEEFCVPPVSQLYVVNCLRGKVPASRSCHKCLCCRLPLSSEEVLVNIVLASMNLVQAINKLETEQWTKVLMNYLRGI